MTFLITEDCLELQELISMVVRSSHPRSQIITASNGQEAISLLSEYKDEINVVICDYNMPLKNGGDVFLFMENNELNIPFVLISTDLPQHHKEFLGKNITCIEKPSIFTPLCNYLKSLKTTKK